MSSEKEASMQGEIDNAAGMIWRHLQEHGETTLGKLKQQTKLSDQLVSMGIGWLARGERLRGTCRTCDVENVSIGANVGATDGPCRSSAPRLDHARPTTFLAVVRDDPGSPGRTGSFDRAGGGPRARVSGLHARCYPAPGRSRGGVPGDGRLAPAGFDRSGEARRRGQG